MKMLILAAAALFSNLAFAHEFHTPNVCHKDVANFCAHLGYHKKPVVGEAHEFVVDLVTTAENLALVQDLKVELWMPSMGHGSAPVEIKQIDANHFQVTNAYFVMKGPWSVNVTVVTAQGNLLFEIPMAVE